MTRGKHETTRLQLAEPLSEWQAQHTKSKG